MAGFEALAHVENDRHACATLRQNRPGWNVFEGDVRGFSAKEYEGVDLLAGGVPCPPFSKAGKQLGSRVCAATELPRPDFSVDGETLFK
jgi:DNA (cytosine-5)-methyltransferase 1